MPLKEHVYSVLIVSANEKMSDSLRALLPESDYAPARVAASVGEAQRILQERAYDFVIINAPLPDDFGSKFASRVCLSRNSVALMLVRGETYDEIYLNVFEYGVFTLRKPTSSAMILQALDWMRCARERLRLMEKKTVSLEDKMAEIRIVNHAKWALIESLKMTEADAHRYIEKQAMDRCVTRREVAQSILQTYK